MDVLALLDQHGSGIAAIATAIVAIFTIVLAISTIALWKATRKSDPDC